MPKRFALRGQIVHTPVCGAFSIHENAYLLCEDGRVAGICESLPPAFEGAKVRDFGDCLIIPGLCDMHLHASQYAFRGLGMDMELIEWLNQNAFPEEIRFADIDYARLAYGQFAQALRKSATTRACVFATIHTNATLHLMRLLEDAGICAYVGKVSMDRNAPEALLDPPGEKAVLAAEDWLKAAQKCDFTRVSPMLTPRFAPSCTDALLEGLGALAKTYDLPVQTHLSENPSEIEWVRSLFPEASCYLDVYARFDLAGEKCVMAHCVHPSDVEEKLLLSSGVLAAHCPASNANIASGIAPIRRYLDAGVRLGLGSDIAGGYDLSIFRAMTDAVQVSKLRARHLDMKEKPLTLPEAFYMATKGGGAFFGKVGSFETGCEFDAVVLDDQKIVAPRELSVHERVERAIYLEKDVQIVGKYARGASVL